MKINVIYNPTLEGKNAAKDMIRITDERRALLC